MSKKKINPIMRKLWEQYEEMAPITEPERQSYFVIKAKELVEMRRDEIGRTLTYKVVTFGCQMNARDSEKLAGTLEAIGYEESESEQCDFVIYNTCTVRENANNKVYGRLGYLKGFKSKNSNMMIAVCGCMMQEPKVQAKIEQSYRFVDLIFGTHNLYKFAEFFTRSFLTKQQTMQVIEDSNKIVEELPIKRKFAFKTGVNITFGCNNFCTYCIVPYVRGREKSRKPEDILAEIRKMADDGVIEVMLLGQNVNSYGNDLEEQVTFPHLLQEVEQIEGIQRIRFMTSHPKDLSDELIEVCAQSNKICKHIHLPVQSGSTNILGKMNRRYTKESYLELVNKIRTKLPEYSITTDIIVGFPGETEEDFMETMDLVQKVQYDSAFTFEYSKRTGTPAATMANQVPHDVVAERFDRLLAQVQKISRGRATRFQGKTYDVLVENVNEQDSTLVTGKCSNNMTVHFPGNEYLIGQIIPVKLTTCMGFYYIGELVQE